MRVLGGDPNPTDEIPPPVEGGGGGGGAGLTVAVVVVVEEGGGRLEGMNGEGVEDTGMDARGGEGARGGGAGKTVVWIEELMRFSISSMSDWEDGWRGIVSLLDFEWDIFLNLGIFLFEFDFVCNWKYFFWG